MVEVCRGGVFLKNGREIVPDAPGSGAPEGEAAREAARRGTMTAKILAAHNRSREPGRLSLVFDALASHDITFVNIIQTALASGLDAFPVPYILTNCHNSLAAVGGTINEDDHLFGLSAARRYGGVYVPPHLAVIHTYIRETRAGCGGMILGSDSHTRYGSLGTMGVGEGGGEIVKQLLGQTYDMDYPPVIAVYLSGKPAPGVGPQDAALAIIGAVFPGGFVRNAALEFVGPGIAGLSADFRAGVDVMTTETACWSSVWETDGVTEEFLASHLRRGDYAPFAPDGLAYYDGLVRVNLSELRPMMALPFHPSNVRPVDEVLANAGDILRQVEKDAAEVIGAPGVQLRLTDKVEGKGRVRIDQAVVAGCAGGTFGNIMALSSILEAGGEGRGAAPGNEGFSLSVYPGSQPVLLELAENGTLARLASRGVIARTAFCGPCFGAGDVPGNNCLSVRHTTRNFPHREGSRPQGGQAAAVCLMDARSVAATARNGGFLASAFGLDWEERPAPYRYNPAPYRARVYDGSGRPDRTAALRYGPNITAWPEIPALGENLLVKIAAFLTDPVTTTDELIPSGETSSYRSNPLGLAEFTLSRKDPSYVPRAKAVRAAALAGEKAAGELPELEGVLAAARGVRGQGALAWGDIALGSALFARRPGDGSAREQAASCQRVLGGLANFAREYATRRYRSNLINWGILPFIIEGEPPFGNGDWVFVPGASSALRDNKPVMEAWVIPAAGGGARPFALAAPELNPVERDIMLSGCLINYNRKGRGN
ncbi:MAG: hydratase/aconitase family protein [Treponematales bacterium]